MFNRYIEAIRRRWWIALIIFGIVMVGVVYFVWQQPVVYETTTTLIMRPRQDLFQDNADLVRALDTLSRQVEINSTYAKVAQSSLIKEKAIETLGLSADERKGISIAASVVPGTNVVEIKVKGRDPGIISDFANTVSSEVVSYVQKNYDIISLEILDEAKEPRKPVQSQAGSKLILGAVFALMLALGIPLLIDYVLLPRSKASLEIIDPATGLYNREYFMLRLKQEVSRSKRMGYPLSVGLMSMVQIKFGGQILEDDQAPDQYWDETLLNATRRIQRGLRDEDLLARYDRSTLALLLPDRRGEDAQWVIHELREYIHDAHLNTFSGQAVSDVSAMAGVAALQANEMDERELLDAAGSALAVARNSRVGRIELYTPQLEAFTPPVGPEYAPPEAREASHPRVTRSVTKKSTDDWVFPTSSSSHSDQRQAQNNGTGEQSSFASNIRPGRKSRAQAPSSQASTGAFSLNGMAAVPAEGNGEFKRSTQAGSPDPGTSMKSAEVDVNKASQKSFSEPVVEIVPPQEAIDIPQPASPHVDNLNPSGKVVDGRITTKKRPEPKPRKQVAPSQP